MSVLFGVPGALKILKDRLTATRAGYLDHILTLLNRWTDTRAGYVDAIKTNIDTLLARLTSDRAAKLDNLGYVVTQFKEGSLSNGSGSALVTITEITANRAFIVGSYDSQTPCTFKFNSTTQVAVARSVTDGICNYKFWVVEWKMS